MAAAELILPTDRYGHAVLGDALEWGGLRMTLADGRQERVTLPETRVFEDVEARLADVTGDGLPEVVVHNETGFVVPREDPASLAQALERLVADADLRRAFGAAGRKRVRQHYEWSHSVDRMLAVLEAVSGGRPATS